MSNKHDIHFGRQGGRIVDFAYAFEIDKMPRCEVCGQPMVAGQRKRHHLCDQASIVGRACVCVPNCSDEIVGDRACCADDCEPCRIANGQLINGGASRAVA